MSSHLPCAPSPIKRSQGKKQPKTPKKNPEPSSFATGSNRVKVKKPRSDWSASEIAADLKARNRTSTSRVDKKQPIYGLFIDFSNAYNNVPHTLLLNKLRTKGIFTEDEIQYLEALHSRYRLNLCFWPNQFTLVVDSKNMFCI